MEISAVRNRLKQAMVAARERARQRRQRATDAERAYDVFLERVATPVAQMVAAALKAEGYAFTVFTPAGGLRLASDRGRDDYVEFTLDTTGEQPQVVARVSYARGSRTREDERPVKPGASPETLSEEDVLAFLVEALEPWLER